MHQLDCIYISWTPTQGIFRTRATNSMIELKPHIETSACTEFLNAALQNGQ